MGGGGGRGRGRGGGGGLFLSSSLNIRVSNVTREVDQNVMRRVFESVGVAAVQIDVFPREGNGDAFVIAHFADPSTAARARDSLNGFNIFDHSNTMSITFAKQMNSGGMGRGADPNALAMGSVLPVPQAMGYGGVPPAAGMGVGGGLYGAAAPYAPFPQQQAQAQQPMMMPPGGAGMPMVGVPPPFYGGRGGGRGMRGGPGGRGMRGGGGVGRGGAPQVGGFNPMMGMQQPMVSKDTPSIFISVTVVPETEPLHNIFILMEAFGGVFSIRRNQKQKDILTVKTNSIDDAENIVRYLRRVPYAGGTVSAKRFPTYTERNPCTDEGDAKDPETTQFDFTASRHRSPGQRSKCQPSRNLRITGCSVFSEEDIANYLNAMGFEPASVTKEESDGSFVVSMVDTATAVKALIQCHGNVCSEERSNVIFVEGPPEESEANNATTNASGAAATGTPS